jgi:L-alanine-DL-glutamate epimerase-like enolase superfamily enzyme
VGRAIRNFYRAEQDPMSSPVLIAEGYTLADGMADVPEAPGLGLRINEARFASGVKVLFDIKS